MHLLSKKIAKSKEYINREKGEQLIIYQFNHHQTYFFELATNFKENIKSRNINITDIAPKYKIKTLKRHF